MASRSTARAKKPTPAPSTGNEVSSRASWKGTLSFGLVNLQVRLAVATEDKAVRFNQVHRGCGGRIRQKKACDGCGEFIDQVEIAKGYPIEKDGPYIELSDEDFDGLPLASKKVVDVSQFVGIDEIDMTAVSKTYYLLPDERVAERGYALLRRAMAEAGKVGIGKVAFKESRERLCVVRPFGDGLLAMHLLFWPDEVRTATQQDGYMAGVKVETAQLDMATKLIESMTEPFDPTQFTDTYRELLLERIDAKKAGRKPKAAPAEAPPSRLDDLNSQLEASVKGVTKKPAARKPAARRKSA